MAPRKYGKSSLIKQILYETNIPGKRINLLPATNTLFVRKAVKMATNELFSALAPKSKKAKQTLIDTVKGLHPKLTINLFKQQLELSTRSAPETDIGDMLTGINSIAKTVNKKIVFCFDEFQQISSLKSHSSIEASIRHAVESSTHVTYIFSGSNRHLLSQMFSEKSRPLYRLFDLMLLDRIQENVYLEILLKRAKKNWSRYSNKLAISEILILTQCHPYYVNALCRRLWKNATPPDVADIQVTWFDYIEEQRHWITDDLGNMTPNQRNVLAAICHAQIDEPTSQEFVRMVDMGASSIKKSLDYLTREDFVYRDKQKIFKVLDPAIEAYLKNIKYFDFS